MNSEHVFGTTLVLSTGHMPESEPDFGHFRKTEHEFGWMVWISPVAISPLWLRPAVQYALKNSCTMILFDRDALKVDHLQLWDW